MNTLTLARNKLEAAQELLTDAIYELDGKLPDEAIATLTWSRGEIAHVIIDMQKEGEE